MESLDKISTDILNTVDALEFKYNQGIASVEINGKWGFVDKNYNFVIEPMFDKVSYFSAGFAEVRLNG